MPIKDKFCKTIETEKEQDIREAEDLKELLN